MKGVETAVVLQGVGAPCCFASTRLEGPEEGERGGEGQGRGGGGWAKGTLGLEEKRNGGHVGGQAG